MNHTESLRLVKDEKTASQRAAVELTQSSDRLRLKIETLETDYADTLEKLTITSGALSAAQSQIVRLRAERDIVKSSEARLVVENKSLSAQNGHMNELMASLRKMQSDLMMAEEGDKRRWEARATGLEETVEELRGQLGRERELVRSAQWQKDSEVKVLREKVDKAVRCECFKVANARG